MKNEKKIWQMEQYAHKAWTVSLVLAQEAARAGQHGKGYAVVAHEARMLADKLFEYTEKARFEGDDEGRFKGIVDFAIMTKFLSVNAAIEIQHMAEICMDFNIPKSMSVFAEELRRIAIGLDGLADKSIWQKPFVIPEVASPSQTAAGCFFLYSICGYPLIENILNIYEVCYARKSDTEGATFYLRGLKVPILNCYRRFDLPYTSYDADRQTVILLCPDRVNHPDQRYAVLIDELDVNALFNSMAGCAVPVEKGHAFADYARECWDAVGGDQLIFMDWQKLISK